MPLSPSPSLRRLPLLLALTCACTAGLAQSPTRIKAGLWEHSFEMRSQSGQVEAGMKQAQAAMANMTPQQRKMMEEMMAKQGIGLSAGGQKVRMCLTPEDVARDAPPPSQEGCTQKATRSGNTWTVNFQCPARDGRPGSSGDGTVTVENPGLYTGKFTIRTQAGQKSEVLNTSTQGRWVSADCGAIKPVAR